MVKYLHEGGAAFGEGVFHLWRNLRVHFAVYQAIVFQLFQVLRECLVGNLAQIALHLIKPHRLVLHKAIENHHLVFAGNEREGVAVSCALELGILDRVRVLFINYAFFQDSTFLVSAYLNIVRKVVS